MRLLKQYFSFSSIDKVLTVKFLILPLWFLCQSKSTIQIFLYKFKINNKRKISKKPEF